MASQKEIAAHLDMSDRNLRDVLSVLGLDYKTASVDEIRTQYIRHLRKQAAAHSNGKGDDIVKERVLTEKVDREIKLITLGEKRGELVARADVHEAMKQFVISARIEINSLKDGISNRVYQQYGVKIAPEILNEPTTGILRKFSTFSAKFN